jgi:hypothetical protein
MCPRKTRGRLLPAKHAKGREKGKRIWHANDANEKRIKSYEERFLAPLLPKEGWQPLRLTGWFSRSLGFDAVVYFGTVM